MANTDTGNGGNSLGWIGALVGTLTSALDPSGQASKAFAQGFVAAHQKKDDDDDSGTPSPKGSVASAVTPPAISAPAAAAPAGSQVGVGASSPATPPVVVPPVTASPPTSAPASSPSVAGAVAPKAVNAAPMKPSAAPPAPFMPQVSQAPVLGASPLTALFQNKGAGDVLSDVASDSDVWGKGATDHTIAGLAQAIGQSKGIGNDPAVYDALSKAMPSLRRYYQSDDADEKNKAWLGPLINGWSSMLLNKR